MYTECCITISHWSSKLKTVWYKCSCGSTAERKVDFNQLKAKKNKPPDLNLGICDITTTVEKEKEKKEAAISCQKEDGRKEQEQV